MRKFVSKTRNFVFIMMDFAVARHIGRIVRWYTQGGFRDHECGHWHHSGFKYKWYVLAAVCFVYTCRRLIDRTMIAGTASRS